MSSVYKFKKQFQQLIRPIYLLCVFLKLSPNSVTLIAVVLSIIMGGFLACFPDNQFVLYALPLFLLLRMVLNAIDGMLAREQNKQTPLGTLLNEFGDIISDIALYLPFALMTGFSAVLMVFIVILSIMTETAGILALKMGIGRSYEGPCGKSDRAFIFGLIALLLAMGINLTAYLIYIQITIIILLIITIFNRLKQALE